MHIAFTLNMLVGGVEGTAVVSGALTDICTTVKVMLCVVLSDTAFEHCRIPAGRAHGAVRRIATNAA